MASESSLELREAARTLSMLVRLGRPLNEGLRQVGPEGSVWPEVAHRLEQGDSPEQALQPVADGSPIFARLVSSALQAPTPEPLLQTLSRWLETSDRIRAETRHILTYPFALAVCLLAEFGVLLLFAVPAVLVPFAGAAGSALSTLASIFGLLALFASIALLVTFRGERIFALASKLPKFDDFLRLADQALWAKAMSALLGVGVDLPKALSDSPSVMLSAKLRAEFHNLAEEVSRGSYLSSSLSRLTHVDPHLKWAVTAGESRENLEDCLSQAGVQIENRLRSQTRLLLKLLEPLALLLVGLLTCALVIPFWLSLYSSVHAL